MKKNKKIPVYWAICTRWGNIIPIIEMTRRETQEEFVKLFPRKTWKQLYRKGARAVKVRVVVVEE
jgi:hypothetical protein